MCAPASLAFHTSRTCKLALGSLPKALHFAVMFCGVGPRLTSETAALPPTERSATQTYDASEESGQCICVWQCREHRSFVLLTNCILLAFQPVVVWQDSGLNSKQRTSRFPGWTASAHHSPAGDGTALPTLSSSSWLYCSRREQEPKSALRSRHRTPRHLALRLLLRNPCCKVS